MLLAIVQQTGLAAQDSCRAMLLAIVQQTCLAAQDSCVIAFTGQLSHGTTSYRMQLYNRIIINNTSKDSLDAKTRQF